MSGDFDVTFDLKEILSLRDGYTLAKPKLEHGHEIVRVAEDTGSVLKLQHLLVMQHGGKLNVIKHWRQDWTYEPKSLITYTSSGVWNVQPVNAADRKGRWSQTVWQADDSPRYGAVGYWRHANGISAWTSDLTRRPLPRRDAERHPPYSYFEAVNKHIITPAGWAHEQQNTKIGLVDGKATAFADESGINTYTRATVSGVADAETYWSKTKDFWADVRGAWDDAAHDGVVRAAEGVDVSVITEKLLDIADDVASGKRSRDAASGEARRLIAALDAGQTLPPAENPTQN